MNPQFLRPISPLPRKALCLCPQGLLGMVELLTLRTVFTTGFVWKINWQGLRTWWIPSNSFRRREGTMRWDGDAEIHRIFSGISRWGLDRALRKGPQTKLQRRKGKGYWLPASSSIKVFLYSAMFNNVLRPTMFNNVQHYLAISSNI